MKVNNRKGKKRVGVSRQAWVRRMKGLGDRLDRTQAG